MNRNFDIFYDEANKSVTLFYLEVIASALKENGFDISFKQTPLLSNDGNYGAVVINYRDVKTARKLGYKFVIYWMQGITPEEHFLTNKNIVRFIVRSLRERKGLKKADFVFYCSDYMKKHCEKKYLFKTKKYYIMPCFNEEIHKETILSKDYSKNEFIYAGSLAKWQCFEKIVQEYKKIEDACPNVSFSAYVQPREEAEAIMEKYGVKNFKIDFVDNAELNKRIASAKFGFCLRDNVAVNKVATPTKLSNYVSNGLIPIFSRCLDGFYWQSKKCKYSVCVDDSNSFEKILDLCKNNIINRDIYDEFRDIYGDYYSKDHHSKSISSIFNSVLLNK